MKLFPFYFIGPAFYTQATTVTANKDGAKNKGKGEIIIIRRLKFNIAVECGVKSYEIAIRFKRIIWKDNPFSSMVALMELMAVEGNQIKLLDEYLKEKPNHPIKRQLDVIKAERRKMPDNLEITQEKETVKVQIYPW